jgi:hypothetical protein
VRLSFPEVAVTVANPWGNSTEWSNAIPPEIHPADADVLTSLLNEIKHEGMVVLEVGSWVGNGSTRVIVETIRDVGGTLYCVDTWAGSDNVSHHREYRDRCHTMFTVFFDNVRKYNGHNIVRPLVMPSIDASRIFADGLFDLVFIDGNHGYSHAKQDVLAWLPKVKGGGVLCGHDCEVSYPNLDAELRAEIDQRCEEDYLNNLNRPGPPGLHPGVVKAVHEVLGPEAKLWSEIKPTTVWSYRKPVERRSRSVFRVFSRFFRAAEL